MKKSKQTIRKKIERRLDNFLYRVHLITKVQNYDKIIFVKYLSDFFKKELIKQKSRVS